MDERDDRLVAEREDRHVDKKKNRLVKEKEGRHEYKKKETWTRRKEKKKKEKKKKKNTRKQVDFRTSKTDRRTRKKTDMWTRSILRRIYGRERMPACARELERQTFVQEGRHTGEKRRNQTVRLIESDTFGCVCFKRRQPDVTNNKISHCPPK